MASDVTDPGDGGGDPCCKVGRTAEAYGLDDLDRELAARWNGVGGESESLRDLAAYVNRSVLRRALSRAGVDAVDDEVAVYYRHIRGEAGSEGARVQVVDRLEREGIDLGAVESAFVSHQTVHTHLRECRDVSRDADDAVDAVDRGGETVFRLQRRTEAVTENTVGRLAAAEDLALDEFDVFVDVRVSCSSCGRFLEVGDLFESRGCPCRLSEGA